MHPPQPHYRLALRCVLKDDSACDQILSLMHGRAKARGRQPSLIKQTTQIPNLTTERAHSPLHVLFYSTLFILS